MPLLKVSGAAAIAALISGSVVTVAALFVPAFPLTRVTWWSSHDRLVNAFALGMVPAAATFLICLSHAATMGGHRALWHRVATVGAATGVIVPQIVWIVLAAWDSQHGMPMYVFAVVTLTGAVAGSTAAVAYWGLAHGWSTGVRRAPKVRH